jgi:hypothetical protein
MRTKNKKSKENIKLQNIQVFRFSLVKQTKGQFLGSDEGVNAGMAQCLEQPRELPLAEIHGLVRPALGDHFERPVLLNPKQSPIKLPLNVLHEAR